MAGESVAGTPDRADSDALRGVPASHGHIGGPAVHHDVTARLEEGVVIAAGPAQPWRHARFKIEMSISNEQHQQGSIRAVSLLEKVRDQKCRVEIRGIVEMVMEALALDFDAGGDRQRLPVGGCDEGERNEYDDANDHAATHSRTASSRRL